MKLETLLKEIRPLPWPVNAKIEEKGALTFEQLAATRIYRRHAANVLPGLVEACVEMKATAAEFNRIQEHKLWEDEAVKMAYTRRNELAEQRFDAALMRAENVELKN